MLHYDKYLQVNNLEMNRRSFEMYVKYLEGEEEIMKMNCKQKLPSAAISFGICTNAPPLIECNFDDCKQEGTTPMNTNANSERDYLRSRLNDVSYDLIRALQNQFNIGVYTGPRTYKELIDWVTNGKYTLNTKRTVVIDAYVAEDKDHCGFCEMTDGIIWNGRGVQDHTTYNLAIKAMEKAKVVAKDVVMTSDAAAGLKALQDFEAWTYTVPTVTT